MPPARFLDAARLLRPSRAAGAPKTEQAPYLIHMVDLALSGTWRKRSACVRCRNLKARCEYASPTDQRCVRCSRGMQECVIPARRRREGAPAPSGSILPAREDDEPVVESERARNEQSAVYLQQIVRDAQQKFCSLKISHLRCLIAANQLTWESATKHWEAFKQYPGTAAVITVLGLPHGIEELDERWPFLAYAVVAITKLNSANTSLDEYTRLHDILQKPSDDSSIQCYLDRLVAYALLCRFAVPFQERGLLAVMILHGLAVVCISKLEQLGWVVLKEFVRWLVSMSLLPLAQFEEFRNMRHIYSYYYSTDSMHEVEQTLAKHVEREGANFYPHLTLLSSSRPAIAMLGIQDSAFADLDGASTVFDVSRVVETAFVCMQKQETCLRVINEELKRTHPDLVLFADSEESDDLLLFPVRSSALMMRLKVLKRAIIKILDIMYTWAAGDITPEPEAAEILARFVAKGAEICALFARSFAYINSYNAVVPTASFYFASEALLIMHMLRIASFAGGVNYAVRVDCSTAIVSTKWEEMLKDSILARQFFFLVFRALTVCSLRIGVLDGADGSVSGTGELRNFHVYSFETKGNEAHFLRSFTREELLELVATQARDVDDSDFGRAMDSLSQVTVEGVIFEHWSRR